MIFKNENGFRASKFEPSNSTTAPAGGASPSVDVEASGDSCALTVVGSTKNETLARQTKTTSENRFGLAVRLKQAATKCNGLVIGIYFNSRENVQRRSFSYCL